MARNTTAQVSITYPITNEMPKVIKKQIDARARGVVFTIISIYDPLISCGTVQQSKPVLTICKWFKDLKAGDFGVQN
jgi:hypothetical protein